MLVKRMKMINEIKHALHRLAINRGWYSTVYMGKLTIQRTIFGKYFTDTDYMSCPLGRLIQSEIDRSVEVVRAELLQDLKCQGERDKQIEALEDFTKLNIKGILPD